MLIIFGPVHEIMFRRGVTVYATASETKSLVTTDHDRVRHWAKENGGKYIVSFTRRKAR